MKDLIEEHPSNRRNYRITTDEITSLISKRTPKLGSLFWKDIISGQLDADRMDYLLRDSLHAGVSYGRFDLDRIVSSVCAVRRPQEELSEPKIGITRVACMLRKLSLSLAIGCINRSTFTKRAWPAIII